MKKYYVYLHKNPVTQEVFYVGKGVGFRSSDMKTRNKNWVEYVNENGIPIVEIDSMNLTEQAANEREMYLIAIHGRRDFEGGTLVNISLGGSGTKGVPRSENQIKFMVESNPAKSAEARLKISKSKLGKPRSAETKAKLSISASSRRPEVAAKISAALTGRTGALHAGSKPVASYDKSGNLVSVYAGLSEAAREIGGDFRLISAVCNGKRKYHKGLNWQFHVG